jgi:hypothetical protein
MPVLSMPGRIPVGEDASGADASGTDAHVIVSDARADADGQSDAWIGPGVGPMQLDAGTDAGLEPDSGSGCGYDYGGICRSLEVAEAIVLVPRLRLD